MKRLLFIVSAVVLAASLLGLAAVGHQQRLRNFGTTVGLPDANLAQRPHSIAGVNVALEQYADLAIVLDSLSGFQWLRQTFAWDQIETAPGQYDWSEADRIVAAVSGSGHNLTAVLNFSPAWARSGGAPRSAPPESADAFGQFAGQFAARYGDAIDVYQVWDEPNLSSGWGDAAPSAIAYAALLQAAYAEIHAGDPDATVIAAALAPTLETGPNNISDLVYLQQLYDLGAASYFDAAAGKPYGFYTGPDDRLADSAVLNFSRFTLLRQIMVRNGDSHKLLWAGNFGWNTQPSPWGQATTEQQTAYSLAALERAQTEWPWAGALALENYQPAPDAEPARWGFALVDEAQQPGELLAAINRQFAPGAPAAPGHHAATHPAATYTGGWVLSDLGADIPEAYADAGASFRFQGSDLGLMVRRGNYRGHLYVEVNGRPANLLPRDEHGAYLILTSPGLTPDQTLVPVASGLDPDAVHTVVITPERGWGQWALAGYAVGRQVPGGAYAIWMAALAAAALAAAAGVMGLRREIRWPAARTRLAAAWRRLGSAGQLAVTAAAGGLLYVTSWMTWGDELVHITRRFGDTLPIAVTALTAGLFYFSPSLLLALLAVVALLALFTLRLDLALAFTALVIPFYMQYRLVWQRGFALTEVFTLLALAAWLLVNLRPLLGSLKAGGVRGVAAGWVRSLSLADWAVLAFVVVSAASTLAADLKPVAVREFRLAMLEPAIFYWVLRRARLDQASLWRVLDFFVLGAVAVAMIGLGQLATGSDIITAEGGVARIRSVYGSPNNLALYLDRALPLTVAVVLMGWSRRRRILYAAASLVIGAAIVLTFSRGALLLGVPAGLAVVLLAWQGRRGLLALAGLAVAGLAALPMVLRLPRFSGLLDLAGGTTFFRTRLWISGWRMFLDRPWLGVGPDNFLYQYRSRYILPDAWQEPDLSHPHNIVLDFLSRLGVAGLAVGVWMQAVFWRSAWVSFAMLSRAGAGAARATDRPRQELAAMTAGLMGLVAAMLAHGLVDHAFFLVDLAFVFFLALAAVEQVRQLAAEQS